MYTCIEKGKAYNTQQGMWEVGSLPALNSQRLRIVAVLAAAAAALAAAAPAWPLQQLQSLSADCVV